MFMKPIYGAMKFYMIMPIRVVTASSAGLMVTWPPFVTNVSSSAIVLL